MKHCDSCSKIYPVHSETCVFCGAPEWAASSVSINPSDWIYDLETYPDIFTATFIHADTGSTIAFEVSDRINQLFDLYQFLIALKRSNCRMVGFNNLGFDYPILHFILLNFYQGVTLDMIYQKAMSIINTPWERRFDNLVWDSEIFIPQIDLFKIHHFDNESRRTKLKALEFAMRLKRVEDLPFEPGKPIITNENKNILLSYNKEDCLATVEFYIHSLDMIKFREELSEKYQQNFMNYSDSKIGKSILILRMETELPGSCYTYDNGKQPRQTRRESIALNQIIFSYITFGHPEFQRLLTWFKSQAIYETKGTFTEVSANVNGFKFDFGTGGIHGSIDSCVVESDNESIIYDWDVKSYYPNLSIKNKAYPAHLSEAFCTILEDVYNERGQHAKGTAINAAFKIALNSVYGDSNSKFSPFYDPQFTMTITINGQLLLCMLAENLFKIPGLQMLQINTDGLTIKLPKRHLKMMHEICNWWERFTCLELESAVYKRMFIRDVNNYIAEDDKGKIKRKGAYTYETPIANPATVERPWFKNHSALVIPKAAEAYLLHGQCIDDYIKNHSDIFDFMLLAKVGNKDKLIFNDMFGNETELQKLTRYYVSNDIRGGTLTKVSPPPSEYKVGQWKRANGLTDYFYRQVLNELPSIGDLDSIGKPWDERINTKTRTTYDNRKTAINAGWIVTPCNDIDTFKPGTINYNFYITEAEKLVKPIRD